jgi:hypothetical protein
MEPCDVGIEMQDAQKTASSRRQLTDKFITALKLLSSDSWRNCATGLSEYNPPMME